MVARVVVTGEDLVAHHLRTFGRVIEDEVKQADERIASQTAQDARSRAYSIGGVAGHVAPSIASHGGDVTFGGGLPMAMGAEFGRDAYAQFAPWTGSGESAGYFLIPSAMKNKDDATQYEDALDNALRRA